MPVHVAFRSADARGLFLPAEIHAVLEVVPHRLRSFRPGFVNCLAIEKKAKQDPVPWLIL